MSSAREQWLAAYRAFCSSTSRPYQEELVIRRLVVDTYALWAAVQEQGGSAAVTSGKLWAATARRFNHPQKWTNASHIFRTAWEAAGLGELEAHLEVGQLSLPVLAELAEQEQQEVQQEVQQQQQQQQDFDDTSHDELGAEQPQLFADQLLDGLASALPGFASAGHTRVAEQQQQLGRGRPAVQLTRVGASPEAPLLLAVRCGCVHGVLDVHSERAYCHCDACVAAVGPRGCPMTPTEFERHGGCAVAKKWKKSLTVVDTGRNVGQWLKAHGLLPPPKPAGSKKQEKLKRQASSQGSQVPSMARTGVLAAGGPAWQGAPAPLPGAAAATQLTQPLPGVAWAGSGGDMAGQQLGVQALPAGPPPGADSCWQHALVGRVIWVWWPLDGAWYSARVVGYQEQELLHTLQYADGGELECCNLREQAWMEAPPAALLPTAHAASSGTWQTAGASAAAVAATAAALPLQHLPAGWHCELPLPVAAAAQALQWQAEEDDDERAWLAAAQASMAARPLRVVFDSSTDAMRVLLAADLLAAEHEVRMQLREQQHVISASAAAAPTASRHGPLAPQHAAGSWHGGGVEASSPQGGIEPWQAMRAFPAPVLPPLAQQPGGLAQTQLHAGGGAAAGWAPWVSNAEWAADASQQVMVWEQQQQQHDTVMAEPGNGVVMRAKRALEPADDSDGSGPGAPPSKRSRLAPTELEQQLQAQLVLA